MRRGVQLEQSSDREKINATEQTKGKTYNLNIAKKRGGEGGDRFKKDK
jgi:hypothetical protein